MSCAPLRRVCLRRLWVERPVNADRMRLTWRVTWSPRPALSLLREVSPRGGGTGRPPGLDGRGSPWRRRRSFHIEVPRRGHVCVQGCAPAGPLLPCAGALSSLAVALLRESVRQTRDPPGCRPSRLRGVSVLPARTLPAAGRRRGAQRPRPAGPHPWGHGVPLPRGQPPARGPQDLGRGQIPEGFLSGAWGAFLKKLRDFPSG